MGGRGSSSGIVAFDVNMGVGTSRFLVRGGKTFRESGDQINLSPDRVIKNAKAAGYDVKIYSASQQRARERRRAADRAATNEFLNTSDAQMGGNRRDQRAATRGRRGSRRGV